MSGISSGCRTWERKRNAIRCTIIPNHRQDLQLRRLTSGGWHSSSCHRTPIDCECETSSWDEGQFTQISTASTLSQSATCEWVSKSQLARIPAGHGIWEVLIHTENGHLYGDHSNFKRQKAVITKFCNGRGGKCLNLTYLGQSDCVN